MDDRVEPGIYRKELRAGEDYPLDDNVVEEDQIQTSTEDSLGRHHFVIPEDRKLGYVSTTLLIVNRMIGTGIFSTPSSIMQATNSVGASLLFWLLGGLMSLCLIAYLELGTAIPRSGGEKNYLERMYRRPKYLASCIFALQFACFSVAAANTVNFSAYILRAAKGAPPTLQKNCNAGSRFTPARLDEEWKNKGISIATITLVCLCHSFTPNLGIRIINVLGILKIIILLIVVCTGFAALDGRLNVPKPDNFSTFDGAGVACELLPGSDATQAANYALALQQVLYGTLGWEGANYVLTEVRNAPKTLKIAAPAAVVIVLLLYELANIAYFAAMTKSEIANSGSVMAAQFFKNAWGDSTFVTRVVPVFIALSALGNVFAQTFANSRVKQELAKEGLFPFSRLWASDWPARAPSGGILLHWLFTVALIVGPRTTDAYPFLTGLFVYSQNLIKISVGIGLLHLTFNKAEGWIYERTSFRAPVYTTVFWILSLAFALVGPFIKNNTLTPTIPWYTVPSVGCAMMGIGTLYWFLWAKIWPLFGYHIQHEVEQLPDGTEVVKYSHVKANIKDRSFWTA